MAKKIATFKAEIEEIEMENFKALGFEVGYYGNGYKRNLANWEWYQSAPESTTRGVRYYFAVFFHEKEREIISSMGGKNIAPIGN